MKRIFISILVLTFLFSGASFQSFKNLSLHDSCLALGLKPIYPTDSVEKKNSKIADNYKYLSSSYWNSPEFENLRSKSLAAQITFLREYLGYQQKGNSIPPSNGVTCLTKYPTVFIHGIGWSPDMFPDYWYHIDQAIKSCNGGGGLCPDPKAQKWTQYTTQPAWGVYYDEVDKQFSWLDYIENQVNTWWAMTEWKDVQKINLVGHSMGGPTCRLLAAAATFKTPFGVMDGKNAIASITTISGVHDGSPVADLVSLWPSIILDPLSDIINMISLVSGIRTINSL
ncbi:MAG: hypothetical protein CSYNP_00258 [Syntrophus sp. SKADARSKE-3]|nr:hypothetical protein [Syntrophus sp. SKADARSKE-3]